MRVKSQKLAGNLRSNLTFRAFSPREAYREGSVKSASHLQEPVFGGHFSSQKTGVPAHFALIIIIVVHVVKHQSVLINTCRR